MFKRKEKTQSLEKYVLYVCARAQKETEYFLYAFCLFVCVNRMVNARVKVRFYTRQQFTSQLKVSVNKYFVC